jgi:hypothetical protein
MMNMFLPRSTASVRLLYLCIALSSVPVLLSHIHDVVTFRHGIFLNNFPSFNQILLYIYIYNQILLLDQEQLKQLCLKTIAIIKRVCICGSVCVFCKCEYLEFGNQNQKEYSNGRPYHLSEAGPWLWKAIFSGFCNLSHRLNFLDLQKAMKNH